MWDGSEKDHDLSINEMKKITNFWIYRLYIPDSCKDKPHFTIITVPEEECMLDTDLLFFPSLFLGKVLCKIEILKRPILYIYIYIWLSSFEGIPMAFFPRNDAPQKRLNLDPFYIYFYGSSTDI